MPRNRAIGIALSVYLLCVQYPALGQVPDSGKTLSVEWIYGPEAADVLSLPSVRWLSSGGALVYDRGRPARERAPEILNQASGRRTQLVDPGRALAAMRSLLGDSLAPETLPNPLEIDGSGRNGLYLFGGDIYLLRFQTADFVRITETREAETCLSFSPDGGKIAYVRQNNLYLYDLLSRRERPLTRDGTDSLLNGTLSWVYWEEVFGRKDGAYWWSDDGSAIAFLQTDESGVSVQYYVDFKPWTPRVIRQRYPKIGQKNPVVRAGIIEVASGEIRWVVPGTHPYEYCVRVKWLPDGRRLAVQTMNRQQTELNLFFADRMTGRGSLILTEKDSGWVNIVDDLHFMKDGQHFLWASERDGYKHLYRYTLEGKLVNRVTHGPWSLRSSGGVFWLDQSVTAVDEENGWIYFTATEKSPLERHLYRVRPDGTGFMRVSQEPGVHTITSNTAGTYYFDKYSSASVMPSLRLCRGDGSVITTMAGDTQARLTEFHLQTPSLLSIPARDGFLLPAQILKPADFDPTRTYPLILYVYGGPSAPQVLNQWERDILWDNLLLAQGFLVARVDPRTATAASKTLENLVTRRFMAETELHDLVDAVRWLKTQPFVDSTRVGIWGWSGGGSYTLLAMTRSKEFKAGIAVAGVTDFRFYDTKFGESAMKTETDNLQGLEETSLLRYAKDLNGRLLIVHGTYDDNVHIQNTWAFIDELIRANKQFELMLYPMRMHGIADRPARIHLYTTMLEFWKRNL